VTDKRGGHDRSKVVKTSRKTPNDFTDFTYLQLWFPPKYLIARLQ
jgi:hypothetical protein